MPPKGPQERDERGLLLIHRLFLQALGEQGSWRKAAEACDLNPATPRRWLHNDENFKAVYDEMFGAVDVEAARKSAQTLAGKAIDVYDELMDAEAVIEIEVQCPECGERFIKQVKGTDSKTRKAAADSALKVVGLMKETKEVRSKVTVTISELTGAERVALLNYEAGLPISPLLEERLRKLELIEGPAAHRKEDVVEGSYTEVHDAS